MGNLRAHHNQLFTVFASVPFVMVLGNAVLIPVLPDIASELSMESAHAALLISVFSVVAGLTIPCIGVLSDLIDRKCVLITGLLLYGLSGIACGILALVLAHPFRSLLLVRAIQGLGAAATGPIATAIIGDSFSEAERGRALGYAECGNAIGKSVSPILGAACASIAWWIAFFAFPCFALPLALWVALAVPRSEDSRVRPHGYFRQLAVVWQQHKHTLMTVLVGSAATLFGLFCSLVYASSILKTQTNLLLIERGALMAMPMALLGAASAVSGHHLQGDRQRVRTFACIGATTTTVGAALTALRPAQAAVVLVALGVLAVGAGLLLPALTLCVTSLTKATERGSVTGIYSCVRFFGVAAGSPVLLWLSHYSVTSAFWLLSVMLLAVTVYLYGGFRPTQAEVV